MDKTAIIPGDMQTYHDDWKMSPGLACGDFVFLTGFTGADPSGHMASDPEAQMRNAFGKVERVLTEAGLDFGAVVEMTSYHVGLREHLQLFKDVRSEFVRPPYPAWTAIEVSGFVHKDAIVEIRVIACRTK